MTKDGRSAPFHNLQCKSTEEGEANVDLARDLLPKIKGHRHGQRITGPPAGADRTLKFGSEECRSQSQYGIICPVRLSHLTTFSLIFS